MHPWMIYLASQVTSFILALVLVAIGIHDLVLLVLTVSPGVLSTILNSTSTLAPVGTTVLRSSSDVESPSDSKELEVRTGWSGGNLHLIKSGTLHLLLREWEPGWSDLTSRIDHLGVHACISYLELFMHPLHKQEYHKEKKTSNLKK